MLPHWRFVSLALHLIKTFSHTKFKHELARIMLLADRYSTHKCECLTDVYDYLVAAKPNF